MKLTLRKSLVAGATAVAVAFSGTGVASAQEAANNTASLSSQIGEFFVLSSEGLSPGEVKDWISVFNSVISAMDTLLSFTKK